MSIYGGGQQRTLVSEDFTEGQVEYLLNECGVQVSTDTNTDFLVFCPFHGNKHTPSMTVSKTSGRWMCWNGACGESGNMQRLIKATLKFNEFQIARLIHKAGQESVESFSDRLARVMEESVDFVEWEFAPTFDRLVEHFWNSPQAIEYMHGRGFNDETLKEFKVGYSKNKNLISVPMYSPDGILVGVIGRPASKTDKRFQNSKKLPSSKTLFNLQRAKRTWSTVIICESSFDAMRIHQAGYQNVVACLGGSFSDHHATLLGRYFDAVIIFTDYDDKTKHTYIKCAKCKRAGLQKCKGHSPGRVLGDTIATKMSGMRIKWAALGNGVLYPEGAKDAGDMTDDQIRQCVKNAVSTVEYKSWNIE